LRRSTDFSAEIQKNGMRWEVNLHERTCSYRAWQVKGIHCVHVAAFIASLRNPNWENYVDSYFTFAKLRVACANGIATMPIKDQWLKLDLDYKILPPKLKRPARRPKKNRLKPTDEPKKRSHRCARCGLYGHHQKTCKNTFTTLNGEHIISSQMKTKRYSYRHILFVMKLL
jgi:hypothetical protein